jgi:hypothetical protein
MERDRPPIRRPTKGGVLEDGARRDGDLLPILIPALTLRAGDTLARSMKHLSPPGVICRAVPLRRLPDAIPLRSDLFSSGRLGCRFTQESFDFVVKARKTRVNRAGGFRSICKVFLLSRVIQKRRQGNAKINQFEGIKTFLTAGKIPVQFSFKGDRLRSNRVWVAMD